MSGWGVRAGAITAGVIALGIGISQIGTPVPISKVYTNSSGVLSGSGTVAAPLSMAVTVDGTTITGAGSAGSPLTSSDAIDDIRWSFAAGLYGFGTDGNATISSNTNATADLHYNNLTVSGAATTLHLRNYRLFVKGTLTLSGGASISNGAIGQGGTFMGDGYFAGGQTAGQAAGTQAGTMASAPSFWVTSAVIEGGTSCPTANCTGTDGTDATNPGQGGSGGGSSGSGGQLGGPRGGAITRRATTAGVEDTLALYRWLPIATNTTPGWTGGSGGGMAPVTNVGGTNASARSGGGGGGILWIAARKIVGTGTLKADGFDGSAGLCAACGVNGQCAGGSGGGGGGLAVIFYGHLEAGVTVRAWGGVGGNNARPPTALPARATCSPTSAATSGRGGNGADGTVLKLNMSGDGS